MDSKLIFVRTSKGSDEANNKTSLLDGDIKRALLMVDGASTFGDISKRAAPSLRSTLDNTFNELEKRGFIQDKAKAGNIPKIVVPAKMSTPLKKPVDNGSEELDFTSMFRAPTPEAMAAEGAKVQAAEKLKAEAEANAGKEAEAAKLKVQQEAEMARRKAEQDAAQARAELEAVKAKAEAEARARVQAEAKAKQEIEAARLKAQAEAKARAEAEAKARQEAEAAKLRAQQEAEMARRKAEQDAAQARAELEAVKAKAEAEARARALAEAKAEQEIKAAKLKAQQEAEAARQKAEKEAAEVRAELEAAKARAEAEEKARVEANIKQEIEAAKLKAHQEAEEARLKAEREAAKAREEAELAKQKALAEARAREDAERRAREQAEAARVKAEQEAARTRAELEAAKAKAEAEAKARAEAEVKARQEVEAAKLKAQQEAEEARLKAEREAAKAREEAELVKRKAAAEAKAHEEAERRAREKAEAERVKAEQDAARVRSELEAAKAKAEAEAARLKAEQEAAKAYEEAERVRQQAAAEASVREEAEQRARQEAESAANLKAQQESEAALLQNAQDLAQAQVATKSEAGATARTTSVTVLFFDVVGYTKQSVKKQIELKNQFNQLVSDCLKLLEDGERIILDTGDGAAIGFMQHPDDALEVAIQFRKTVMANQHKDYPDLNVRIGIHLGPINIIRDMNGRSNMVGDGINDAQRVMSFAGTDQIYISRSYYDFVSRLSDEYAELFQYRGAQKDKHGREHPVYELVDTAIPAAEVELQQTGEPVPEIKLEPFSFKMPDGFVLPKSADIEAPAVPREDQKPKQDAASLISDVEKFLQPEEARKSAVAEQVWQQQTSPAAQPSPEETVPEPQLPKEEAKPAAKSHMPSEAEVTKLAEAQAKSWAEAEQRAIEAAKANAERAVQPQHRAPRTAEKDVPATRTSRKPISWGAVGAGLFAVLLAALFAAPYVLPMKDYVPKIEQMLAARLKQPVHIGRLAGRLLPAPRLELSDVSIGELKQIQAQQARVDFALSALFSDTKPVTGVNLEGVRVNGAALQQVSAWLQQIAADPQYPIARIELNQGKLETDGVQLSGIGGELSFDQAGKFIKAKLNAEGSKFALDINAAPDNKLQMAITVRGSALPLLPNWVFDELTAKGELTSDELVVTDLDGRMLGGMLLGDARINWSSDWKVQGTLVAKTITTQNMSQVLSGDMDGNARFQMQSASLSKLADTATLDGTFVVKKGVINGFDIVETARQHSRESLPGGRTHFDELSGELSYASGDYHFKQLKMNAGVLNATGALDIAKQQLSGRVFADLAMRTAMGSVALQVDGTTSSPSLRAVR